MTRMFQLIQHPLWQPKYNSSQEKKMEHPTINTLSGSPKTGICGRTMQNA